MLQLYLSDQQFYSLLRCDLYSSFNVSVAAIATNRTCCDPITDFCIFPIPDTIYTDKTYKCGVVVALTALYNITSGFNNIPTTLF